MKEIAIYTDGACSGNPGPGGWAAVLLYNEKKLELSGYQEETTNNRMELTAVIRALEALKMPCAVHLYSDSTYVVNAFNKGWLLSWQRNNWLKSDKKPVENQDLWKELLPLAETHTVRFHLVKGHSDNEYNNLCDKLATGEVKSRKLKAES